MISEFVSNFFTKYIILFLTNNEKQNNDASIPKNFFFICGIIIFSSFLIPLITNLITHLFIDKKPFKEFTFNNLPNLFISFLNEIKIILMSMFVKTQHNNINQETTQTPSNNNYTRNSNVNINISSQTNSSTTQRRTNTNKEKSKIKSTITRNCNSSIDD